jgi:hypothetical protein
MKFVACDDEFWNSKGVRVGKIPLHLAGRCFDISANCKIPHVPGPLSIQTKEYSNGLHSMSGSFSIGLSSVSPEFVLNLFRYEAITFLPTYRFVVHDERRSNLRNIHSVRMHSQMPLLMTCAGAGPSPPQQ